VIIIGIDPGLTGAATLLAEGWAKVLDLPTKEDEPIGRRIDCPALASLLQEEIPPGRRVRVCIEALANGGFGRTNAATVGSQFWTQSAVVNTLELLGLSVEQHVSPSTWKKFYGLSGKSPKEAAETMRRAREIVTDLYPDLADRVSRQKDHNRAESVLIAHWFRKVKA
jgi:hypothetical protein